MIFFFPKKINVLKERKTDTQKAQIHWICYIICRDFTEIGVGIHIGHNIGKKGIEK